jgi:Zn-dependent protease
MKGRLSLNPIVHIDPFGTIILPAILIYLRMYYNPNMIVFGWAKPVPVNFFHLKKPKKHMTLVSLAGPATNFIMAFFALIVIKMIFMFDPGVFSNGASETSLSFVLKPLSMMLPVFFFVNVALGFFNLIPVPPLDGGRILTGLLPGRLSDKYAKIEPFGMPILILLIMSGAIDYIWFAVILIIAFLGIIFQVPILDFM